MYKDALDIVKMFAFCLMAAFMLCYAHFLISIGE